MIEQQNNIENNNQNQIIKLFWLGFIIYSITYKYIQFSPGSSSFTIPGTFMSLGLILIFSASIIVIKWRFEDRNLKVVFTIYMIWLFLIIIRGLSSDFQFIKDMLFDVNYGAMPYLVPLLLLFPKKISFYKQLFTVIVFFAIFYLIINLIFGMGLSIGDRSSDIFRDFTSSIADLIIPSGFILLTYKFHSLKRRIFSVIVFGIGLLIAIYAARRVIIFIYSTQILFSFLLYLSQSQRKFILIMYSVFLSFFMIYYLNNALLKEDNPLFSYFMERGLEDTRTGVELALYSDLNTKDWIIGKGISGEYYCPGVDPNNDYRTVIESGHLQIILRGGLISLILILLIAIPAIFFGVFHSKNTLSKAAGIWILLWILYLYPTTMDAFSLYYIIFWVSIGISYSKDIRNMSDEDILKELHTKNKLDNRVIFDNKKMY